jgi:hypothetical protein
MPSSACAGFWATRFSRRDLLRLGGVGMVGLSLPHLLRADGGPAPIKRKKARSVIFLHQWGGPSHLDTFDPKPNAPQEIRGELKTIATSVPGIRVTELLPNAARIADKLCFIRTMTHEMKNHNSAGYYSLTGYAPPTDDIRLRDSQDLFPSYGSVADRFLPGKPGLPAFVSYPYVIRDGSITPGQHASFLGKKHDPFFIGQDPNSAEFRLPELSLPANLPADRLENRRAILKLIDEQEKLLEVSGAARGIDAFYERALTMLTSPAVKKAFDLGQEPTAVRDRYGRTTYGQGCLLARRLVEAGVRFVNVYFAARIGGQSMTDGWDTHGFNDKPMYPILKNYLIPITDQALPTLLNDLGQRGLLDETLVVWVGEFGRTPKLNATGSRDHWPQCYTALLAGGGVKGGFSFGVSDRNAGYPASDPVRPEDLSATLFDALGIDPHVEIRDPLNRPLPLSRGRVLSSVFR